MSIRCLCCSLCFVVFALPLMRQFFLRFRDTVAAHEPPTTASPALAKTGKPTRRAIENAQSATWCLNTKNSPRRGRCATTAAYKYLGSGTRVGIIPLPVLVHHPYPRSQSMTLPTDHSPPLSCSDPIYQIYMAQRTEYPRPTWRPSRRTKEQLFGGRSLPLLLGKTNGGQGRLGEAREQHK